jgi:hypothetical protein
MACESRVAAGSGPACWGWTPGGPLAFPLRPATLHRLPYRNHVKIRNTAAFQLLRSHIPLLSRPFAPWTGQAREPTISFHEISVSFLLTPLPCGVLNTAPLAFGVTWSLALSAVMFSWVPSGSESASFPPPSPLALLGLSSGQGSLSELCQWFCFGDPPSKPSTQTVLEVGGLSLFNR